MLLRRLEVLRLRHWLGSTTAKSAITVILEGAK